MSTESNEQYRSGFEACPFCGSHSLYERHVEGTIVHPAYYVECDNCGARGPTTDKGTQAEDWNRRAKREASTEPSKEDIGWKMAKWLLGMSASELLPNSWRATCAELSAAWNEAGRKAGPETPSGSAETRMAAGFEGGPKTAGALTDDAKDAARYRYLRVTTTAIREPETGERIECTPGTFDQAIDAAILAHTKAGS